MICEVCGKDFFEDWRVIRNKKNRTPLRFCSLICSRKHNARNISYEDFNCQKCETPAKRRKGSKKVLCEKCLNRENYCRKKSSKENVKAVKKRRYKLKMMSIEYKGNKCQICGYNKYYGALQFHHIDPKSKEFQLSKGGLTRSWDRIKKELDKCILLCANCHAEIHAIAEE